VIPELNGGVSARRSRCAQALWADIATPPAERAASGSVAALLLALALMGSLTPVPS
jgi:hypothetical protein